jgi:hypothetical protein
MTENLSLLTPSEAIGETATLLKGCPVFLAGSVAAAETYGKPVFGDVDLFTPSMNVLISTVQIMLDNMYTLDDRFDRVWHRWLRYGTKKWHTNSIRLHSTQDVPVNVVFKLQDGHPTTSLSQVIESFDFGLLSTGYDLETGTFRDLRSYLFPSMDPDGPLPMMPNKRDNWRLGFISQYNGLREAARYAKYTGYGYDMSAVKDDLVTGYEQAASYHLGKFDEDKQLLGEIYAKLADRIIHDEIDELAESYKTLDFNDSLDEILESLE